MGAIPHPCVVALPPVLLRDAVGAAPAEWQPVVAALLDLGETVGITPRVFGALLWEDVTGLPYLTAQSDLDLLRRGPDVPANLLRAPLANMTKPP